MRLLITAVVALCGLAAGLWSLGASPARAQTPVNYFYCYAVDESQGIIFVSDTQEVGVLSERASYGDQFKSYLRGKGKASDTVRPYCVMRPTPAEIRLGQNDLRTSGCRMCNDISRFEDVVWMRDKNKGAEKLLDRTIKPSKLGVPEWAEENLPMPPEEEDEQDGVYILGSREGNDLIYAANEENGGSKTRLKADLKGGKWTTVAHNNRCPGWMAVAYASDGTERVYYLAQGAESQGEASLQALDQAEQAASRKDGNWTTGVLLALENKYRSNPLTVGDVVESLAEDGVIETAKGLTYRAATSDKSLGCPRGGKMGSIGVRG